MTYQVIDNFSAGLDTRKSILTSPSGTLTRLVNAVITPGGEIAKRRAFVQVATVTGSFGLAATSTDLAVFGRNAIPPAATLTADGTALAAQGISINRVSVPNANSDLVQTDFDIFDGRLYLACMRTSVADTEANAKTRNPHFYADPVVSGTAASKLTEGAGKGFYVRTYQSKVYSVRNKLLSFSVINNPMLWQSSEMLEAVNVLSLTNAKPPVVTVDPADIGKFTSGGAAVIDGSTGTGMSIDGLHNISSVNSPANTFRLTYADTSTGAAPQTLGITATPGILADLANTSPAKVTVSLTDIVKFTTGSTIRGYNATGALASANGLHAITNINTGTGTFDLVGVNLAAAPAGTTNYVVALDSGVPRTGAGWINLSLQDADAENLTSLEVYYDKLAVFSSESVQIWAIASDPAQNAFEQLLRGAGSNAPRSPLQYGSGDVLYLGRSGIRSLKARDSSNSAAVSDIGSPVDPVNQTYHDSYVAQLPDPPDTSVAGNPDKAISLLEPSIGRFWMIFPKRILVLSYFPGPQITAWSEFTLAFEVAHAVTCAGKIFIRDTLDRIWVYGGANGSSYDNCGVEVRLPYLDGKKPGHKKQFAALDASLSGTWRVAISYDFNNPDQEEVISTLAFPQDGGTWNSGAGEVTGYDSHFSLRFYNPNDNYLPATISNCAVHYEMGAHED